MTNAEVITAPYRTPPGYIRWTEALPQETQNTPHGVVEFRVLGPVEAVVGGRMVDLGTPKQRALLALLISRVGQPVTADVMLEELWAGHPPPSARTSLHAYVANLRRVLEPDRPRRTPATVLCTHGQGYRIDSRRVRVDVHRFCERATAGWHAWGRGDRRQALGEFEAGLALWRGQAYAEVGHATHVIPEVERLEELRLSLVEGRCAALLAAGAHEVAVAELEAFMQAHPLREYGCELLSLALYRAGRQADALAVLRTNQKRLAEELGIDPRPALQHLESEILNQAPALDWQPPAVSAPAVSLVPPPGALPELAPAVPPQAGPQVVGPQAVPDGAADAAGTAAPAGGAEAFVGREAALRQLDQALAAAAEGRGQVVAVSGEPGSGKTGLLRRFGRTAGVPVLWGACPEHVRAPRLWPWLQVLRAVADHFPRHPVPAPVVEFLEGDGALPAAEAADPESVPLRLCEAIVGYLTGAAELGPLAVAFDHAQRADRDSLRLLAHIAGYVHASRLLVVVAHRSGEPAMDETAAALAREGMTTIALGGLTVAETRTLARAMLRREVGQRTAQELWERTEGNPFFLRELIKLLTSEQRLAEPGTAPVPAPVREVLLRRVAQLPYPAAEMLSVASIAGRHFDIDVVAEAASVEIEAALEALDAAVEAGLVAEDQQRLGWFRFTHGLTAEVLYEKTGRLRRAYLHERLGRAAARSWTGNIARAMGVTRPRSLYG
ncbi:BTAD domain-containing putative transcriptional regulator [Actinacidiphila epipremni]|uniref:AAA family ATPase n=1 Tax=Actinacidiphila epipremni TaxID=2053013 RepID=A0ABX0ZHN7_9ACTN|nr:BTAD domain-containing putative transcriptional regulator [Actinacidiphila epipremni]NJP43338.1 AAA family ATPase [Actinacidiphila epipremni]